MSKLIAGTALALLTLSQPCIAQDAKIVKPAAAAGAHGNARETLDASMARLAMKAALQPSAPPTQQELIGLILLMSLRGQKETHI
ncbi:MAG TPA: hypothetical protein VG819_14035 [Rhizomicrobium sp.]|jgi:hypothetical protein|nr:hypothetical protein [Rhizomicrobium sp.]